MAMQQRINLRARLCKALQVTALVAATSTLAIGSAFAAAADAPPDCALRIGSGPEGKLYARMARDMAAVCSHAVSACAVPSVGGIPNLLMLSASQAELGIVQVDTLQHMARGGDENIAALQAVMQLHTNLLHVVALRNGSQMGSGPLAMLTGKRVMRNFSDLKDARVAVVGSTRLLGQALNGQMRLGMVLEVAESDDQAIEWLRANRVQAVFTDGGWPLPSIERHAFGSGLMLVNYDGPVLPPFSRVQRSYEKLNALNLSFLGSPNLLVTRPFKPGGEVGRQVLALQACLLKNMDNLKEGRYEAAWKDIKAPQETLGVVRFGPATPAAPSTISATSERRAGAKR